jgi:hypothetical protein
VPVYAHTETPSRDQVHPLALVAQAGEPPLPRQPLQALLERLQALLERAQALLERAQALLGPEPLSEPLCPSD